MLDASLASWFDALVGREVAEGEDETPVEETRIVDMLKWSQRYFSHPAMNGSHSIKRVLDSIWASGDFLWADPWFAQYYTTDADGRPLDPYQTLKLTSQSPDLDDSLDADGAGESVTLRNSRTNSSLGYTSRRFSHWACCSVVASGEASVWQLN